MQSGPVGHGWYVSQFRDSEELHWIAWRNTMAKEGIVITREQFLSTFGQRNDQTTSPVLVDNRIDGERRLDLIGKRQALSDG
jgi:hypothetical protein